MNVFCKYAKVFTMATLLSMICATAYAAPSFTLTTLATGTSLGTTSPDSVDFGLGSIWVSYQNGADSTGLPPGASTVVRYSLSGSVQHMWSIAGNVDGLRIDPSGQAWALQNNDGNSTLTVINPTTFGTTLYTYGPSYSNVPNRGFDDVVFLKSGTFLSETNPAGNSDPIVLKLTSGLNSPLQVSGILNSQFTGTNLATGLVGTDTISDSDSLVRTPNGDLALTGEADGQVVFIHNPGAVNQSQSFLNLLDIHGNPINAKVDDTAYATSSAGYFLLADTGANTVYKIYASGLTPGSVFVDVGHVFGSLDLTTGIVTPIFTGTSPHGVEFVPAPEPGTMVMFASGVLGLAGVIGRKINR